MWTTPTRPRPADGTIEAEMAHRIVILGGGTGGTLAANRLRRLYGDGAEIVVVDRDDRHVYRPGLLFVPFGLADPERLVRSRRAQLLHGVELRLAEVEQVDTAGSAVELAGGETLGYDALVIAGGAELQPEETEGLSFGDRVHTFYTLDGAVALRSALGRFERGRLVVNMVDLPITCPVAPLEFCFLADSYLRARGIRDQVELTFATPLDAAFTKPAAAERLNGLLARKRIRVETEFGTGRVDGEAGVLSSWDERELEFDLLVTIPLHCGPAFVGRSPGLGDELGFAATDPATLQAKAAPNVFAIGDAAKLPISKAGSAAHFQGETLVTNVRRYLAGEPLVASYDGHVNCFVETGDRKALLLDFDYEHEPLPGHFGPLPLLRESRANHLAKIAFQWLYWHLLLPGRELPGIGRLHGGTT
jgi:sulfide:quinone oxidoreductase